jgi:hypothetical protein
MSSPSSSAGTPPRARRLSPPSDLSPPSQTLACWPSQARLYKAHPRRNLSPSFSRKIVARPPHNFSSESRPNLAVSWRSPSACSRRGEPSQDPEIKHVTSPSGSARHPPIRQPRKPLERRRRPHPSRSLAGDRRNPSSPVSFSPLSNLVRPIWIRRIELTHLTEQVPTDLDRPDLLKSDRSSQ